MPSIKLVAPKLFGVLPGFAFIPKFLVPMLKYAFKVVFVLPGIEARFKEGHECYDEIAGHSLLPFTVKNITPPTTIIAMPIIIITTLP